MKFVKTKLSYKYSENIGILELSSRAVKAVIGNNQLFRKNEFSRNSFASEYYPINTGKLINSDNCIDPVLFDELVIPAMENAHDYFESNEIHVVYAIATEIYRRSQNQEAILYLIKDRTGFNVNLLTPEQEAEYFFKSFLAFKSQYIEIHNKDIVMVDAGGASCEVIFAHGNTFLNVVSFPFGSEVLKKYLFSLKLDVIQAIKATDDYINKQLDAYIEQLNSHKAQLGVLGGRAIKTLAPSHDLKAINKLKPSPEDIRNKMGKYAQKLALDYPTLVDLSNEIKDYKTENLLSTRLILPIYLRIMEIYQLNTTRIATTGVAHGVYWEIYTSNYR